MDLHDSVGTEKAAILLLVLGEEQAAEILKRMDAKVIQAVGHAMTKVNQLSHIQVESVMDDFLSTCESNVAKPPVPKYIKNIFTQAFGGDKAATVIDKVLKDEITRDLDSLNWMDTEGIINAIKNEHPQVIAITLVHLEHKQAYEVLQFFSPSIQADVMLRVAQIDKIPAAALSMLEDVLQAQLSHINKEKTVEVNGPQMAANIINCADQTTESSLMTTIVSNNPPLAEKIQDLMFVFDDLATLDDSAIQAMLREVTNDVLTIALKGTDPRVKEKIYANMSKRAMGMLEDDMEERGPVRLSEVESSQQEILSTVKRLVDEGVITLQKGSEQYID